MKQFFYLTIFFAFASTSTFAQSEPVARNIRARVAENNLLITWNEDKTSEQGSWEVQASADGKSFATIGLVWGADPKTGDNSYAFKQHADKQQAQYKYFRVLYVAGNNTALASNTIGLSK